MGVAGQSIPSGVTTTLTAYDVVQLNVGGISYNAGTGVFSVPSPGRYLVEALVTFGETAAPSTSRQVFINYINAVNPVNNAVIGADNRLSDVGFPTRVTVTAFYDMQAGDGIQVQVFQNSGANVTAVGGAANMVSITRLCGPSS